ncbi:MAG TPA: hypothetical protein VMF06_07360, partial [Candidatus Limnocylindria bacterium]|nr:hypothetical protein [Candidatus Limnocylindria bacterium]
FSYWIPRASDLQVTPSQILPSSPDVWRGQIQVAGSDTQFRLVAEDRFGVIGISDSLVKPSLVGDRNTGGQTSPAGLHTDPEANFSAPSAIPKKLPVTTNGRQPTGEASQP